MEKMYELHPAYIAGLFDGEGCITSSINCNDGNPRYKLRICLSNTNREILDLICIKYGGAIYWQRGCCTVQWGAKESKLLLETMLPFSFIKKRQIELALEFIHTLNYGKTPSIQSIRLKIHEELRKEK